MQINPAVIIVCNDAVNMTAACVENLRARFHGDVILVDISMHSEKSIAALAQKHGCTVQRLISFDERQFYAHSTALDIVFRDIENEYAILLDNDAFVLSSDWFSVMTRPFETSKSCCAAGPPRYAPMMLGGTECLLLETWSTCLSVENVRETGLSFFAGSQSVRTDDGRIFKLDTLDSILMVSAMAGKNIIRLPEIFENCFHIGGVTIGNYLCRLFVKSPKGFANYFEKLLRMDAVSEMRQIYRIMINAYHAARFFKDPSISEQEFKGFADLGPGRCLAGELEEKFARPMIAGVERAVAGRGAAHSRKPAAPAQDSTAN